MKYRWAKRMLMLFCFLGISGLFAGELKVEVDQHFKTWISNDDLLTGYPFLSNLKLQAGGFLKLTDVKGGTDFFTLQHGFVYESTWCRVLRRILEGSTKIMALEKLF